jgi:hypothetical protein
MFMSTLSAFPAPTPSSNPPLDQGLEQIILQFAIRSFPYSDALKTLPGQDDERVPQLLSRMIQSESLKIGFHYEEMQDKLTLLYFLRVEDDTHVVLGLDPQRARVSISDDVQGLFRLNDEQYLDILQTPLC